MKNYYKRIDKDGNTTTVEGYSHNAPVKGAIPITKAEFDDFINSRPVPDIIPPRDIVKEFEDLVVKLKLAGSID